MRRTLGLVAACCAFSLLAATAARPDAHAPTRTHARTIDCGITSPIVVGGHSVFPQLRRLHAGFLVLAIEWAQVAPTRPTDPTDPEDLAYEWAALDTAFGKADAAGIEIVPEVYATPGWAN